MIDFSRLSRPKSQEDRLRDAAERVAAEHAADRARRDGWSSTSATMSVVEVGMRRMRPIGDAVWTVYGTVEGRPGIRRLEWFEYPWGDRTAIEAFMDALEPGDALVARGYVNRDGATFQAQHIEGL